ncbi:hypothetical protein GQ42DRAFT_18624 [Ramicandelaber brevisporus]|nr:hypothetical protein GQ42DRAFT_18624 [Ramicandelaber brevisporus]
MVTALVATVVVVAAVVVVVVRRQLFLLPHFSCTFSFKPPFLSLFFAVTSFSLSAGVSTKRRSSSVPGSSSSFFFWLLYIHTYLSFLFFTARSSNYGSNSNNSSNSYSFDDRRFINNVNVNVSVKSLVAIYTR